MLLTDGCPNTTEDLRVYESAILDVASTEFIDLKTKLDLAVAEISEDVIDVLLDRPLLPGFPGFPGGDPQGALRRVIGVSDVVVTPQLKRWHALHTLAVVYRDVFNNQLNDRYQVKLAEYTDLERTARDHTLRFGIGLVLRPIPRAAQPTATFVAAAAVATTYFVQVAWVGPDGKESAPSFATSFDAAAGSVPSISAGVPPAIVTGFNVFAGLSPETLALQNSSPAGVGQTFTLAASGLAAGRAPMGGQPADVFLAFPRISRRG